MVEAAPSDNTATTLRECETTSWISRAMRVRSDDAASSASTAFSRASCAARSCNEAM